MWAWGNGNGDVGGDYAPFDHKPGGGFRVGGDVATTNVGDSGDACDRGDNDGDYYLCVDDACCDLIKMGGSARGDGGDYDNDVL